MTSAKATAVAPDAYGIGEEEFENVPLLTQFITIFGYAVLIAYGHLRDFMRRVGIEENKGATDKQYLVKNGFSPLYADFASFYTRNLYVRIRDCWNRPITGVPGAYLDICERTSNDYNWTETRSGNIVKALNMGSYNYLGFAENTGVCADYAREIIKQYGLAMASPRNEMGTTQLHLDLERTVADFLGKEDAMVFGMGFATNSTNIPALVGKGGLIISDELNHASLVLGCKLTGAKVVCFKHNDMEDLESVVRTAIVDGQPKSHRAWTKIMILVEGIYSMEGSVAKLKDIVRIKKKYKCYLYLDEAHSIGALGRTGRGSVEYWGVNPKDVDILMGTFTKSFGASGGYIAASQDIIDQLKHQSHGWMYASSMSMPVAAQTLAAFRLIMGEIGGSDGVRRIRQLRDNSRFMRTQLKKRGYIVYGNEDSPIIPMLLCNPAKIAAFSHECLKRGMAVVVVGAPACPMLTSRARFCVSASHTHEDMEKACRIVDAVSDLLGLRYGHKQLE